MTFFPPNGTTDLARQPDEMCVRTFVRKIFATTWARSVPQWMLLRQCDNVFVPKRDIHAYLQAHSLPWPVIQLVSDNRAKQSHTAYHDTFRS